MIDYMTFSKVLIFQEYPYTSQLVQELDSKLVDAYWRSWPGKFSFDVEEL